MYTQQRISDVLTAEEYEKHAIIKPPKDIANDIKYTRVVIDSTFRDQTKYPNPNDYYFVFDDDIDEVASARLISVDVPFSTYTINMYFNTLWVQVGLNVETAILLDQGDYNLSDLAVMLQTKLNAASLGTTFSVTYDARLGKLKFAAGTNFAINFAQKTNSLHNLLGFQQKNYASTANEIISPYKCNIDFNNYIVMCIDGFDTNKSNIKPLNKSFAIITPKYLNLNLADKPNITKNFNPPLARLAKIHVTFFDKYGNPYDFQNIDHRFEIMFHSFKQHRKYQHIF